LEFELQGVEVTVNLVFSPLNDGEVAIAAVMGTERDVNVSRPRYEPRRRIVGLLFVERFAVMGLGVHG
jgi:hypothetical protein